MNYLTDDELEKRLDSARKMGASEMQISQKRNQYRAMRSSNAEGQTKKQPFLVRAGMAIADPAIKAGRDLVGGVGAGVAGVGEIGQRLTVDPQNKNKFFDKIGEKSLNIMTPQGREAVTDPGSSKAIKLGLQRGAGVTSYLVPGGTSIKSAAALGALSGGLRGASEDASSIEEAVGKTFAGGVGGGIAGGAMYGAGNFLSNKLGGASNKLQKTGADTKIYGTQKTLGGKPSKRLGGVALYDDLEKVGIRTKDIDSLADDAARILKDSSDELDRALNQNNQVLSPKTVKGVVDEIQKRINDSASVLQKQEYQKILDIVDQDLLSKPQPTLRDLYRLKQAYGPYTKPSWDATASEKASAKAFNFAYNKINETLDDVLKSAGFDQMRQLNKASSTAIRALDYFDDISSKGGRPEYLGFADTVAGLTGLAATGSPVGAMVLGGAAKYARSGGGIKLGGSALTGAGKVAGSMGNLAQKISPILQSQTAQKVGQLIAPTVAIRGMGGSSGSGYFTPTTSNTAPQPYEVSNNSQYNNANGNHGSYSTSTGGQQSNQPVIKTPYDAYNGNATRNDWVVHPDGDKIWNPNMQRFVPYDAKTFGGGGAESAGTEFEKKLKMSRESIGGLLGDLESGVLSVQPGQIASRWQGLRSLSGDADPAFLAYKQRLEAATISLRNAMLGANMTPQEIKRFDLPTANEPLETALPKLRAVYEELNRWSGGAY